MYVDDIVYSLYNSDGKLDIFIWSLVAGLHISNIYF